MNTNDPVRLTTAHLILRPLEAGDVTALCRYRSEPEVARFQGWEAFGPEDAQRLIDDYGSGLIGAPGKWLQLAIVEEATQTMIGDCGLHHLDTEPQQMKVGITLGTPHQGRGYATEALRGLMDFIFGTLDMHRLFAVVDADNHRSAALFRRLGFRQEAHFILNTWFKGKWGSEFVFAMLKEEWTQLDRVQLSA